MKRANGEGSIAFNEKRNRYEYRISFSDPCSGLTKRKTFTSKKSGADAKRKAKAFLNTLNRSPELPQTLLSWLEYWLMDIKFNNLKPKTYERYAGLIKLNIAKYKIAQIPLSEITSLKLQKHLNELIMTGGVSNSGLSPRTVNATRRLLIAALDWAVDTNLIPKNPARRTKPIAVSNAPFNVLTHEEGNALIKAALKKNRYAWIIITIALGTGLRTAEIHGLEWKNIDFDNKTLTVEKTVVTTSKGKLIQDSTKTSHSRRTIALPENVVSALKRYRLWLKMKSIRFGWKTFDSPWVLPNEFGEPRSPSTFSAHWFKHLLNDAGITRNVRIHDLRHTHATWLIGAGVNIKVVADRLGHASIRITLDTYSHVVDKMQEEAVNALEKILI